MAGHLGDHALFEARHHPWTATDVYVQASDDLAWAQRQANLLQRCMASMEARDHPDATRRIDVPLACR